MDATVVLIQDNTEILEIMDEVLTDEGFDVISSLTTEPIEKIEKIDPDIIIIDENIKGKKSGSEVIADLKADPITEKLPAVLTSTDLDLPEKAKQCLADDYLEKPFDIDQMIDVVKKNF